MMLHVLFDPRIDGVDERVAIIDGPTDRAHWFGVQESKRRRFPDWIHVAGKYFVALHP